MTGRLHGIGLGPGDPDLVTMKAVRILAAVPVVAYFAKAGRRGHARTIVDRWLGDCRELPLAYPVTTEIPATDPAYATALQDFYARAAERIAAHLAEGRDVALVCEGDPLFYGSFMHLYVRLRDRYEVEIVPGVTGMSGCWTAAGQPMTWGDDVMTILPGTLDAEDLTRRLRETDAAVIMKVGRHFAKVRACLAEAGMAARAIYVERGTMGGEKVMTLADKTDDAAPYFSIVLVPGQGRRV